jgi:hypothetical protein
MADSIKITQTFSIVAPTGEAFSVQEHTRCSTVLVNGVKQEQRGRVFYKTVEGRGVLMNVDTGTYAIPSLQIKSAKRQDG